MATGNNWLENLIGNATAGIGKGIEWANEHQAEVVGTAIGVTTAVAVGCAVNNSVRHIAGTETKTLEEWKQELHTTEIKLAKEGLSELERNELMAYKKMCKQQIGELS